MILRSGILFLALFVAGCADNPVGPVASSAIRIIVEDLTAADITGDGRIEGDAPVTQAGGEWAAFVAAARAECGGTPAGIEVVDAGVELLESSNVESLRDVIDDYVDLYFDAGPAGRVVAAGSTLEGEQVELPLPVLATRGELAPILTQLLAADFRVGISAEPDEEEELPAGFSLDLALDFQARALCE